MEREFELVHVSWIASLGLLVVACIWVFAAECRGAGTARQWDPATKRQ